ncbi:hypothetical protein KY327_03185 [Candidatus Woesearchaeota archaeon]|nr:hypothetical protein [Candidatus Woesearchaeota archaeon]
MDLTAILSIAVILIVVILSFRLVKGALKFVLSALGAVLLIALLLGALVYMDAQQARELMDEGDKVLLYRHGDDVVTGVRITGEGLLAKGEGKLPSGMDAMGQDERDEYEKLLDEEEPEDDELLIVVKQGALANATNLKIQGFTIPSGELPAFLASDEPKAFIAARFAEDASEEAVLDELSPFTDDELKAAVFMTALAGRVDEEGASFLVDAIREERVRVEPRFFTIWMLRHLPTKAVTEDLTGFINATTGEA